MADGEVEEDEIVGGGVEVGFVDGPTRWCSKYVYINKYVHVKGWFLAS